MTSLMGFPLKTPSFKYHSCLTEPNLPSCHVASLTKRAQTDMTTDTQSTMYGSPFPPSLHYDESTQTKDKHMSKLRRRRDCHL